MPPGACLGSPTPSTGDPPKGSIKPGIFPRRPGPNKKLTGLTLAEIQQRLGALDLAQLPSAADAAGQIGRANPDASRFFVRLKNRAGAPQVQKHGGSETCTRTSDEAISPLRARAMERISGVDDAAPIQSAVAGGSTRWKNSATVQAGEPMTVEEIESRLAGCAGA